MIWESKLNIKIETGKPQIFACCTKLKKTKRVMSEKKAHFSHRCSFLYDCKTDVAYAYQYTTFILGTYLDSNKGFNWVLHVSGTSTITTTMLNPVKKENASTSRPDEDEVAKAKEEEEEVEDDEDDDLGSRQKPDSQQHRKEGESERERR